MTAPDYAYLRERADNRAAMWSNRPLEYLRPVGTLADFLALLDEREALIRERDEWEESSANWQVLHNNQHDRASAAEREREALIHERDEARAKVEAAVAQCRHLHQDGKTREQWHLDNCGAMRGVRAVETVVVEWEGPSTPQVAQWKRQAAKQVRAELRAALADGGTP